MTRFGTLAIVALAIGCIVASASAAPPASVPAPPAATPAEPPASPDLTAILETGRGTIRVRLAPDAVPELVAHFVNLVDRRFYDGLRFHAVSRGVQVHSGDPTGTGKGGCGYTVPKAFHKSLLYGEAGVFGLWTTTSGAGSQFFITLIPNPKKYNLAMPGIGHVVEGLDVAGTIREGDELISVRLEGDASRLRSDFAGQIARWNAALDALPPRGPDDGGAAPPQRPAR